MNCIEVYKIGAQVNYLAREDAKVLEICISNKNKVQYKISWHDGRTRYTEWVESFEIDGNYKAKQKIGFK
jgi:hypothetical protein